MSVKPAYCDDDIAELLSRRLARPMKVWTHQDLLRNEIWACAKCAACGTVKRHLLAQIATWRQSTDYLERAFNMSPCACSQPKSTGAATTVVVHGDSSANASPRIRRLRAQAVMEKVLAAGRPTADFVEEEPTQQGPAVPKQPYPTSYASITKDPSSEGFPPHRTFSERHIASLQQKLDAALAELKRCQDRVVHFYAMMGKMHLAATGGCVIKRGLVEDVEDACRERDDLRAQIDRISKERRSTESTVLVDVQDID